MTLKMTETLRICNHRAGARRWILGILTGLVAFTVPGEPAAPSKPAPPPVYVLRDEAMMDEFYQTDAERIRRNFDLLLSTAGGSSDPAVCWAKWIRPGQRIGIKISTAPGKIMSTRKPLVDAIVGSLLTAGHSSSNIMIFDRYAVEMGAAGWTMGRRDDGVVVTASTPLEGYNPKVSYSCSYAGQLIWGDLEFKGEQWKETKSDEKTQLSKLSYYSRIVTDKVDVLINVPVLTSDEGIGLYGSIVNLALGVIDNQRRFLRPFFGREENIADLAMNKALEGKWKLNIVDGLLIQYAGGVGFDPKYTSRQGAIWLSEDPVALDVIALALINQKRPEAQIKKVSDDTTAYIQSTAALGRGSTDLSGDRVREVPIPAD
jgi:uncharacterized protein (DUF362 family)